MGPIAGGSVGGGDFTGSRGGSRVGAGLLAAV